MSPDESEYFDHPNRYVCSVLDEMRDSLKPLSWYNFKRYKQLQAMLIEEAQTMVNRMEAALEDQDDIKHLYKIRNNLRKQVKELTKIQEAIKPEETKVND